MDIPSLAIWRGVAITLYEGWYNIPDFQFKLSNFFKENLKKHLLLGVFIN